AAAAETEVTPRPDVAALTGDPADEPGGARPAGAGDRSRPNGDARWETLRTRLSTWTGKPTSSP
ncbi:MAG: hypothetical protein ACR2MO_04380, partial [Acidimicrobiales bacterium]